MSTDLRGILSYWGYILVFAPGASTPYFRPLLGVSNDEIFKISSGCFRSISGEQLLSSFAAAGTSPDWKVETSTLDGCFAFRNGDKYIGSGREGQVFYAEAKREWEAFFPINLRDLDILRNILLSRFYPSTADSSQAHKIGLRHFKIIWNQYEFPLSLNCPLAERFDGTSIRLEHIGNSVSLKRTAPSTQRPVIWIHPHGNIGNRALQYLTAEGIRQHVPYAQIENARLEMWGIDTPAPRPDAASCASTGADAYSIDVRGLGDCLKRRQVEAIAIDSYTFNIDHYPSREVCRTLLPTIAHTDQITGFGESQLVCSIRGAEVLTGIHGLYFPLPPRYYQLLQEKTGLELVFYGQIGSDKYSENLRKNFPDSQFVESKGQEIDFETIRRSKNIALSISTFAWLAAWLSEAERIYVPVGGMFNPMLEQGQTYLPVDDPAFKFVLLPRVFGVSLFEHEAEFWNVQDRISKFVRFATRSEIKELLNRASVLPKSQPALVGSFDATFYHNNHPHVAFEVLGLNTSALGYYLQRGHLNREQAIAFDEGFYRKAYPDAEMDVALGRFQDLFQHFLSKGQLVGCQPNPQA
jgi:hypothetical protein